MQKKVAHFVRKLLPPTASFIRNQIMNHITYDACVVYKEFTKSDFANEIARTLPAFYCENGKRAISKQFSKFLYNRPFRRLAPEDKRKIRLFLLNHNVNILHCHYGTDAGMFLDVIKRTKLPSVVSFYGYDCSSFPNWYFSYGKRYLQQVFKYTNCCFAMSEDMKFDLLQIGCPEDKIMVHYYGTDVQKFYCKRDYKNVNEVTLLIVASLEPQKGHLFLLQALKKIVKSTSRPLRLRIIGDGPLKNSLKNFVASNELADNVCFVGFLRYLSKEFLEEFHKADVFIHPSVVSRTSEKEGIPGTVVEAMATGLPVISTYHAGIPHIIKHNQTGLLVNEWDINTLAEYIRMLAEDSNLRKQIGQKAQQYSLEELDLRKKEIELENIYDFIIENHNKKFSMTH